MTLASLVVAGAMSLAPVPSPPAAALHLAAADMATLPVEVRATQIYLDIASAPVDQAAITFALNVAVSRSNVLYSPVPVAGGRLLRYDLAQLCTDPGDLANALAEHVRLALQDPYFRVRLVEGKHVRAILAPHIPRGTAETWHSVAAGALAPFRADWWLTRVLSSVDGGSYYRLRGIVSLTQEEYLRSRGASEAQVVALESDERAALLRSGVTGKPRRIDVFRGAGVRPSAGTGLVAITHDIFDADVAAAQDPIRNLLKFTDRAREIIVELPNGMHEFTLWDGAGKLVAEAPPNVAADHMIPPPYTRRLEPAIGCIRCHGADGGWKPFANDVQAILGQADVLAEISEVNQLDTLRRLAGLYAGDLTLPLRLGRDSYADAVFRLTGQSVERVSAAVSDIWQSYRYDLVTPHVAAAELGGDPQAVTFSDLVGQQTPENPYIAALAAGLSITRDRWEIVFADAAQRAVITQSLEGEQ